MNLLGLLSTVGIDATGGESKHFHAFRLFLSTALKIDELLDLKSAYLEFETASLSYLIFHFMNSLSKPGGERTLCEN